MADHLRTAAIIRLVYGGLGFAVVLALVALSALFYEGRGLGQAFSFIFTLGAFVAGGYTALNMGAGYGMLNHRPWGRALGMGVAFLELPGFPIGTLIGGYTLWVLFHKDTAALFEAAPQVPVLAAPPASRLPASPTPPRQPLTWE